MGEKVTNEVIVERIENFKEHVGETLKRIETQTIKTNGRVSSLERWRSYLAGGMAIILMLIPIILKMLT